MRNQKPGKIRDQLWYLGRKESGLYLVEGRQESMIISGGMSYLAPDLLRQFETFGIDQNRIIKLLILHAHFDHIGVVPFLKRRHPALEVYASTRGWEILQNKKAIRTINEFSRNVAKRMGTEEVYSKYDLDWRDDVTGTAVSEGDRIDLDDLEIFILETPGHSSCSISAYIPRLKALFASDGGGVPHEKRIVASGNSNFTEFQRSLEKLKDLDVEFVCADHYGYVSGEEATHFIRDVVQVAKQTRALMEEAYRKTGDIEAAAKILTDAFYKEIPDWIVSPEIIQGVQRQMVRHIVSTLKKKD